MGFELIGLENLKAKLDQVITNAQPQVMEKLLEGGNTIKAEIVKEFNEPKSGKVYGSHTASAPGEPPANMTGKLLESIKVRQEGNSVIIGTTLDYGTYLELGTSILAARPYLQPAYQKKLPEIIASITNIQII
jgi:HK97 gp10 family phage protein